MTDGQRKKYEEAAKAHTRTHLSVHSSISAMQGESFFMGCTFASQDTEERVNKLQDENKRLRESLSDCLTLLKECSYDATEVTEKARKLLSL